MSDPFILKEEKDSFNLIFPNFGLAVPPIRFKLKRVNKWANKAAKSISKNDKIYLKMKSLELLSLYLEMLYRHLNWDIKLDGVRVTKEEAYIALVKYLNYLFN
ncbi:MAG: hypothetical protein ACRCVI_00010 [Mycoplasmoidaceae bacterium]